MTRWTAFAGFVTVLVALLLALTRSSAALLDDSQPSDDRGDGGSRLSGLDTTRLREAAGRLREAVSFGDDEDPETVLEGPGGTSLTTLDESDYPSPPPDRASGATRDEEWDDEGDEEGDDEGDDERPDDGLPAADESSTGPSESSRAGDRSASPGDDTDPTTDGRPDPSEKLPFSGTAGPGEVARGPDPSHQHDSGADGRRRRDQTRDGSHEQSAPDESPDEPPAGDHNPNTSEEDSEISDLDGVAPGDPREGLPGDPRDGIDRTGVRDRWQTDQTDSHDRWRADDTTPEDRWQETDVDLDDEQLPPSGVPQDARDPDVSTPGPVTADAAFDAAAGRGFDPPIPAERAGVRVGDRRISTRLLLLNVVASQLLFAGLLVGVTWWADVPLSTLGLVPVVTPVDLAVGIVVGVGLWAASEAGGRVGQRFGVDPAETLRGALAPTTQREWWLLLGGVLPVVALFEEFLFRAVLIGAFAAGFDVPVAVFVVASSAAFGLAHSAQGVGGMVVTGVLGTVLAVTFVLTDSFLAVAVAHYLVNGLEFVVHEGPVSRLPGGDAGG